MIVVDTSALVAILADEPEAVPFSAILGRHVDVSISTGTALEAGIVVHGKWGRDGGARLDALLEKVSVEVVAFDGRQMRVAAEAYRRFGRGSMHPARLNFGDCFAYALARILDAPLLFKGDDFTHTDIRSAMDAA